MSVSKKYQFITGDRVFAKMKGYPAWPARIIAIASEKANNKRYHVSFYGTHQTAIIKAENLYLYSENKDKLGVPKKQKHFAEALKEIEAELNSTNSDQENNKAAVVDGAVIIPNSEGTVKEEPIERSEYDTSMINQTNSTKSSSFISTPKKQRKSSNLKHKLDTSESDNEIPTKSRKLSSTSIKKAGKKTISKKLDSSSTDEDITFKTPIKSLTRRSKSRQQCSPTDESSTDEESRVTFKVPNASVMAVSRRSKCNRIKVKSEDESDDGGEIGEAGKVKKAASTSSKLSDRETMCNDRDMKKKEKDMKKRERREKKKRDKRNFIVAVVNGQCQKIPLYLNRPRFTDRDNADFWDEMVLHYANALKDRLEAGEKLADPHQIMDDWTTLKSFEFVKHNIAEGSVQRINFLRIEAHLLDMDVELKKSLSLHRADTDKCFEVLSQMKELSITPLMLKKQPDVVFTIRRMRNYIGNINKWNMTPKEIEEFRKTARRIRVKADEVYTKFKILFNALKQPNFWIYFSRQVDIFREKTKKMSLEEMLSLVEEPA
ncbi:hypothetical protein O3M35_004340 [Rhynocoris fuscipes]|uniref:PWWP domain-containing protein n=1 Tax=Rhynocoris fuscipes TaxID=488301 RepID=A0AAW1CMD4_9HEMI